jgi:hypothetical protein
MGVGLLVVMLVAMFGVWSTYFLVLPAQPAVCVYGRLCVHRVIRCFFNVCMCDDLSCIRP